MILLEGRLTVSSGGRTMTAYVTCPPRKAAGGR